MSTLGRPTACKPRHRLRKLRFLAGNDTTAALLL
jgi:hypothetical protein